MRKRNIGCSLSYTESRTTTTKKNDMSTKWGMFWEEKQWERTRKKERGLG
jgi:hypothetical protein